MSTSALVTACTNLDFLFVRAQYGLMSWTQNPITVVFPRMIVIIVYKYTYMYSLYIRELECFLPNYDILLLDKMNVKRQLT